MTFSIIIPAYNCEKTLEATVDSVRAAGLWDYEIILVDDGSRDNTPALCDQLCETWPEVCCIHQQNAGVSAARNRGMAEAKGEYLWFVDADDRVEVLNLEPIRQAISDGVDCIMFGMQFLYLRNGKEIMQETLSCGSPVMLTRECLGSQFKTLFEKNYFTAIWNKLIRKSVLTENGLCFDCGLINYEDLHFSVLLMSCCKSAIALPESCYRYINTFGQDRTVERLQRIPNVIAYTDKVVAPFYALNRQLSQGGYPAIRGLDEIALRLYMEAVYFKLKTSNRSQIKQLCTAVQQSESIQQRAQKITQLSPADQRLYRWMMQNNYGKIRAFMKYRAVRSVGSRVYRIARAWIGV